MIRALFGGSFDPVHNGHLAIVDHVLRRGLAERVVVVPTLLSPHKDGATAPAAERLAMVRLAFAGQAAVAVDPRETLRAGPSYTIDTLRELRAEHPADRWRLVVGADNLAGLPTWREAAELTRLAEVVVMPRAGSPTVLPAGVERGRFLVAEGFDEPVSATAIRAMLAAGRLPGDALPAAVARHIRAGGLYGIVR